MAFALLDHVLHSELKHAQSPYAAALYIVTRALARLPRSEATAYRAQLERYKAKRNFVAALRNLNA